MNVKMIGFASIILSISLAGIGCQTQNSGPGLSRKAPTRFIEEPDTTDFVADQLRQEATNLIGGYNRR